MPPSQLRKARMDLPLPASLEGAYVLLPLGEWFVEQRSDVVRVFDDAEGTRHRADLSVADFLEGLGKRQIVFISWG